MNTNELKARNGSRYLVLIEPPGSPSKRFWMIACRWDDGWWNAWDEPGQHSIKNVIGWLDLPPTDTRAPVACNCQSSTNESQISSCAPVAGLTEEDVERVCTGYANSGLQMDCQYGDGYRTAAIAIQNDLLAALSKKANEGH